MTPHLHCDNCGISLEEPDGFGTSWECVCGQVLHGKRAAGMLQHIWGGDQRHCSGCHHVWTAKQIVKLVAR